MEIDDYRLIERSLKMFFSKDSEIVAVTPLIETGFRKDTGFLVLHDTGLALCRIGMKVYCEFRVLLRRKM